LKTGSALYNSGGGDMFGNSFGAFTVDSLPRIPTATKSSLADVAPAAFWSPFQ
jgi:hypothetical protein